METPSDGLPSLMAGYQNGDAAAFRALYVRLRPLITEELSRATGRRTGVNGLFEQTVQEVHRARASYDPAFPLEPWIAAIARHVAGSRRSRGSAFRWLDFAMGRRQA